MPTSPSLTQKEKVPLQTLLFLLFALVFGAIEAEEAKPIAIVSLAPYRYFVNEISSHLVDVNLMVPPGASAHTYEPTPRQMIQASKADLWFRLGEPFEEKAVKALQEANPRLDPVDLREGIPLLRDQCTHCRAKGGEDLHIWLSPRLAKIQAKTIAEALIRHYPAHEELFQKNLSHLLEALDALDRFIHNTLFSLDNRLLMVSHAAYAYFCQDYNLTQLPIEFEGKDPTPRQLTEVLKKARSAKVKAIFTQPEYSDKAARLIAAEIGAKVISVDPYSEDYDRNLRHIAELIARDG